MSASSICSSCSFASIVNWQQLANWMAHAHASHATTGQVSVAIHPPSPEGEKRGQFFWLLGFARELSLRETTWLTQTDLTNQWMKSWEPTLLQRNVMTGTVSDILHSELTFCFRQSFQNHICFWNVSSCNLQPFAACLQVPVPATQAQNSTFSSVCALGLGVFGQRDCSPQAGETVLLWQFDVSEVVSVKWMIEILYSFRFSDSYSVFRIHRSSNIYHLSSILTSIILICPSVVCQLIYQ